ncbi:MAG: DEAD/DEAH box helicase [Balneolaceae bacterium]
MPFSSLGLSEPLLSTLVSQKHIKPTPIQEQAIPAVLANKDVLGIAKTGSGKTASYVLPILTKLQTKRSSKNRHITALVMVPTRELAVQVNEVFRGFLNKLPQRVKTQAVFGGVSINPQMMAMQGVDVLVATPGRLLDLVNSKAVHLSDIHTLVLDEADKMLNMGFADEMNQIFALLPKKRQNLLFSATLNQDVEAINQILLHQPVVIQIAQEEGKDEIDLIEQRAYFISEEKKGPLLRYLITEQKMKQVLVFTSSAKRADAVANKLAKNGIDAKAIHSKKSMEYRTGALNSFKIGHLRVLVTTDLLSRGIDVQHLPYVVNYELPRSPKDYIHRIGRTGRSESTGVAISLVTPSEEHHFSVIEKKMDRPVTRVDASDIDLHGF